MKPIILALFFLGGLITLGTAIYWFANGAHPGWTQTYVTEQRVDTVTGLTYPEKIPRFVPGIEILVAGVTLGTFLEFLGVVLLILNRKKNAYESPSPL